MSDHAINGANDRSDPIECLKRDRPFLFEAPAFWRSTLEDAAEMAAALKVGRAEAIGRSAGGRDIWAFTYGAFEPQPSTTTISSAMASDRPSAFFDPAKRTRPVLLLVGPMHGGETEGMAINLNIVSILERGTDLSGRKRENLHRLLQQARVAIVPCLNPDGRVRAGVRHLCGADKEHIFLVQQGLKKDGSMFSGRAIKEIQPMPEELLLFRGGYYNDDGVNLQHDDFFGPNLAPENQAFGRLVRRELPDGFLTWHAHGTKPGLTAPDAYLSPGYQRKQSEATFYIMSHLKDCGYEFVDPAAATGPPWSFYFQTYFHHASGALPLLCELPHGIRESPYSLDQIIDIGLIVVEAWIDFALRCGLRPRHMDFYGAPPLA